MRIDRLPHAAAKGFIATVTALLLAMMPACGSYRTAAAITAGGAVVGGAVGYSVDHDGTDVAVGAMIGVGAVVVVAGAVLLWVLHDAGKDGPYRSHMN